jgi:hypothetical protein
VLTYNCSVTDNDGQFLLIEAALVIPRWIKPETTKNRVGAHPSFLPSAGKPV